MMAFLLILSWELEGGSHMLDEPLSMYMSIIFHNARLYNEQSNFSNKLTCYHIMFHICSSKRMHVDGQVWPNGQKVVYQSVQIE